MSTKGRIMLKKLVLAAFIAALSFCANAQYFTITGSAGTPTLGACGSGAALAASAIDHSGTINVGTGIVTSCTLNFSGTLVGSVRCVMDTYGLLGNALVSTKTSTQSGFVITYLLSVAGGKIDYHCFIN